MPPLLAGAEVRELLLSAADPRLELYELPQPQPDDQVHPGVKWGKT